MLAQQQPFSPGSKIVAYVRYSGGVEQGLKDRSTKEQTHDIQQFCDNNNLILYRVFEDAGISGTSLKGRDAFFEMINFLKSRPKPDIAGVIVWSLSRFARDINTAQLYKAELRHLGYAIYSLNEQFEDSATGILFETLIDWKNQMYSEEIAAHVSRALRNNFEQFGVIPGTPPRGFTRQPVQLPQKRDGTPRIGHRWVIDPLTAPSIRRAFELKAAGQNNFKIMDELPFYKNFSSIRDIFRRTIYYGSVTYGGVTNDHYVEPIVSKDLWDKVQEVCKMDIRAGKRGAKFAEENTRLLTGLLKCPQCHRPMYVCKRPGKDTVYYSYRCSACGGSVPCHKIEHAVVAKIKTEILLKENVDRMVDLYRAEFEGAAGNEKKTKQQEYTEQLIAIAAKIERVTEAIAGIGANPALEKKLHALQAQEQEIRYNQAELLQSTRDQEGIADNAHKTSLSIMDVMTDEDAPLSLRREAMSLIIYEIVPLSRTSALVRYHLPAHQVSNSVPPQGFEFPWGH